jgi:hypothetical protein
MANLTLLTVDGFAHADRLSGSGDRVDTSLIEFVGPPVLTRPQQDENTDQDKGHSGQGDDNPPQGPPVRRGEQPNHEHNNNHRNHYRRKEAAEDRTHGITARPARPR